MALTGLKEMGCGNCGSQTFKIFKDEKGLVAECCGCKELSLIRVSTPKIEIEFGENSDGCLAVTPK